jgi:hypothetical protein
MEKAMNGKALTAITCCLFLLAQATAWAAADVTAAVVRLARPPVALAPFALLILRVARDGQVVKTDLIETPMVRKTGAST